MTKQEIHEILCNADDQTKMRLAVACQMQGIRVESLEELLANVITGIQVVIEPALENYRYLNGGSSIGGKE